MILGFSTKIKGKPTYFVEKIWEAILQKSIVIGLNDFVEYGKCLPKHYKVGTHKPKLHTIREDKKDRWKVGNDIHFSINVRTKNQFQFAPVVKVKSIQKIEMVIRGIKNERPINVYIDGKIIGVNNGLRELAINDGFDTLEDFYDYFKDGFTGKIIHWTDLKY